MSPLSDLLVFLAATLVDHPDDVKVEEETGEQGVVLNLRVGQGDVGKVIGKQGRTARALRNVMHAAAALRDTRVHVHFVDA